MIAMSVKTPNEDVRKIPLKDVGRLLVGTVQRFAPDAKIIAEYDGNVHGEKARKVVFAGRSAQTRTDFKVMAWLFFHHDSLYALMFMSPAEDYEPIKGEFDTMLASMEFKK
jgi:hypothetical protein